VPAPAAVPRTAAPQAAKKEAPKPAPVDELDDATSTAPSTCTMQEPTSDGFRSVSSKKSRSSRATSDAASTCLSDVSTVKTTKASLLKQVPYDETTFTISAKQVGALLGPKGATLSQIEAQTGAKVLVPKTSEKDEAGRETRAVVVRGPSKKLVENVARICKARIAEAEVDRNLEKLNPDETTATVTVDSSEIGALLGKAGATLRQIEETTKARVSVSKSGAEGQQGRPASGEVRTVIIRGTEARVAAAKEAIAAALRFVDRTIEVPDWSVGELLGRGGKALEKLQEKTGARVDIAKAEGEIRLVRIRARTDEAAAAAEEAILQIARPIEHSIEVTSTEAGVLIGRKGETVKAIQKSSGARLTIDASGRMRTIFITGPTIDNINQAINAMQDVLREELPSGRKARTASPTRETAPRTAAPTMTEVDFPALR
jgi:polyribonucleotide nucleotidyltransferase